MSDDDCENDNPFPVVVTDEGASPYDANDDSSVEAAGFLLYEYCSNDRWVEAEERLAQAPQEASHIQKQLFFNVTPEGAADYIDSDVTLGCILQKASSGFNYPVSLPRLEFVYKLIRQFPQAALCRSYDGTEYMHTCIWLAFLNAKAKHQHHQDFCFQAWKCMLEVSDEPSKLIFDYVPERETMLTEASEIFCNMLLWAFDLPKRSSLDAIWKSLSPSTTLENILSRTKQQEENVPRNGDLRAGHLQRLYEMVVMLLNIDCFGKTATKNFKLLHAIAACRDPMLDEEGLLSLALHFYPNQVMQPDQHGNYPLHIAASTTYRSKKVYCPYWEDYDEYGDTEQERFETQLECYRDDIQCRHSFSFEDYLEMKFYSEDHPDSEYVYSYPGCSCGFEESNDYELVCRSCFNTYLEMEGSTVEDRHVAAADEYDYHASGSCRCKEWLAEYTDKVDHVDDKEAVVTTIAKAFPDAARLLNADRQLPLHCALVSGKTWAGGVRDLVKAYPTGLETQDGKTGLLPFMLSGRYQKYVDTTYELLRAKPEVMLNLLTVKNDNTRRSVPEEESIPKRKKCL